MSGFTTATDTVRVARETDSSCSSRHIARHGSQKRSICGSQCLTYNGVISTVGAEVRPVSNKKRIQSLTTAGLLHPHPDAVSAPLFVDDDTFFLAADRVQV